MIIVTFVTYYIFRVQIERKSTLFSIPFCPCVRIIKLFSCLKLFCYIVVTNHLAYKLFPARLLLMNFELLQSACEFLYFSDSILRKLKDGISLIVDRYAYSGVAFSVAKVRRVNLDISQADPVY